MQFSKYHALGNVYVVVEPKADDDTLNKDDIVTLCSKNYGVSSDGVLIGPYPSKNAEFGLRIFNPDGSEAEKSGNGLRIFCRYLFDSKRVGSSPFTIETKGGVVQGQVLENGNIVGVEMGSVSFASERIPVRGESREVLLEEFVIGGEIMKFSAATIGNPHCVLFVDSPSEEMARRLGPLIENHPLFPNRTNVQFVRVINNKVIEMEIWERGAGYTYASGSSSCAAAAVSNRLGYCGRSITVKMRGGQIQIEISDSKILSMSGPVTAICSGVVSMECFKSRIL